MKTLGFFCNFLKNYATKSISMTVLSLISAHSLISALPQQKMNLLISHHLKFHLYYKMP